MQSQVRILWLVMQSSQNPLVDPSSQNPLVDQSLVRTPWLAMQSQVRILWLDM